jgi:HEAT repeat protein
MEQLEFAKARSAGVEFCPTYLKLLEDEDEDVRRHACTGLGDMAERSGFLPPEAVEALEQARDQDESYLVNDTAAEILDDLGKGGIAGTLLKVGDRALQARGLLARLAHGLKFDASAGTFSFAGFSEEELRAVAGDYEDLRVDPEHATAITALLAGAQSLPAAEVAPLCEGIIFLLDLAAAALGRIPRALAALDRTDEAARVQKWARSLAAEPKLEWPETETVRRHIDILHARHRVATADCLGYLAVAGDEKAGPSLEELLAEEDPTLAAAAALALLRAGTKTLDEVRPKLEAVRDAESTPCPEVLLEALLALGAEPNAGRLARLAGEGRIEFRSWALQCLVDAASDTPVRDAFARFVDERDAPPLARLAAAMAAIANQAGIPADTLRAIEPDTTETDVMFARACALAMTEDAESVLYLKTALRSGEPRNQLAAALYLALARVRSAIPVFSSISDKAGPYYLRAACAAMLVKRGHADGLFWFNKTMQSAGGVAPAPIGCYAARAVLETLPLMRRCTFVNLGRFL